MESDDLRGAVHELWKRHGRTGAVPVVGSSMRPLLADRDEVVVRFGLGSPPRFGEVVAFERDGRTVVHRVLARRRRRGRLQLLERGDSAGAGSWIELSSVLGVVVGRPSVNDGPVPIESRLAGRRRETAAPTSHAAPFQLDDDRVAWMVGTVLAAGSPLPPPALDPLAAEALVQIAERHRVAPLLWHALATHGAAESFPPAAAGRLRELYYANAARGVRVLAELERVGAALDAFEVPWLSLKGTPMAARLWDNVALRPTDDIDLLVREADLERAVALLGELGYLVRDPRATARRRAWHHQVILDRPGGMPSCLELHWSLADRFSLALPDEAALWSRARDHQLDPLDEAVYLAAHLDKHGWFNRLVESGDPPADVRRFVLDPRSENRLLWFADLARSLDRPGAPLAPADLAARARSWNVERALERSLLVLDRLAAKSLPERFRMLLPGRRRGLLARRAWRRWTKRESVTSTAHAGGGKSWLVRRGDRSGFRPVRLLDALAYAIPPAGYLALRYPTVTGGISRRLRHLRSVAGELRTVAASLLRKRS